MSIVPIGGVSPSSIPAPPMPPGVDAAPASFKDFLLRSIHEVNQMQQQADRAVEALFTGGDVQPAEVLTAVQKADLAFRLMMQIRNKFVQAYEELKNIRI